MTFWPISLMSRVAASGSTIHSSEMERQAHGAFRGKSDPSAASAARVIYEYYGGAGTFNAPHLEDLVRAVDKADSGAFAVEAILAPEGWDLLSFVMDPRTGLGRYKDYRISNYSLMMDMIDYCRSRSVEEILQTEDVKERTRRYFEQDRLYREMVRANTTLHGNVIVLDLRNQEEMLHREPVPPVQPVSGAERLDPGDVGVSAAEYRHGLRLQHREPDLHGRHRLVDAEIRRRGASKGGNLPGRRRQRRCGSPGAD